MTIATLVSFCKMIARGEKRKKEKRGKNAAKIKKGMPER